MAGQDSQGLPRKVKNVPTVNVYLSEEEYVKLAHLALDRDIKAPVLARRAIKEFLKNAEKVDPP